MPVQSVDWPEYDYAAVCMVPTPSVDASGIAHLVEHLVFRYSDAFPLGHDLFVANTLLPVKINASTHADVTYFYVTADNHEVFLACLRYLHAGLLQRHYPETALICERDGVLQRELQWYESDADYQSKARALRATPDCIHAGGYSDLMPFNCQQAVGLYKDLCYADEQQIWLFNNKDIAPDSLIAVGLAGPFTRMAQPADAPHAQESERFGKFPAVIQALLTHYHAEHAPPQLTAKVQAALTQQLRARAINPAQSEILAPNCDLPSGLSQLTDAVSAQSSLAKVCATHLASDHIPALPQFIQQQLAMVDDHIAALPPTIQLHPITGLEETAPSDIATWCQPQFWAPRLLGDCYAMGIGHYQGQYWRFMFAPKR